jgi:hypothetical protein
VLHSTPPWRLSLATCQFLLHWCIVHSRPSTYSPIKYSTIFLLQTCTTISFNTFIVINLTNDFWRLEFRFLSVPTILNHRLSAWSTQISHHHPLGYNTTYHDKHRKPGEGVDQVNRFNNYKTRLKTRRWLRSLAFQFSFGIYFKEIKHWLERGDRLLLSPSPCRMWLKYAMNWLKQQKKWA